MNKEEIRPLLVEALERAQDKEKMAYLATQVRPPEPLMWEGLTKAQEEWRIARVKRAEAELQLWLADRQWEAEELAEAQEKPLEEVPGEWLKRFP